MTTAPAHTKPAPRPWGFIVFGICLFFYLLSGQSQPGNDATANVHQALRLIDHGTLFFTPEDNPRMFVFTVRTRFGTRPLRIRDWQSSDGHITAWEAYERGLIQLAKPMYYLVPTRHQGQYANTFGVGAGLTALPVVAPVRLLVHDLGNRPELLWWLGKITAALSTAVSALLLYLTARLRISPRYAAVLALGYGLTTCVFSISSQALWQHGPCEMFMALGAYFLLARRSRRNDALCGLGLGLAVLCRPTAGLVAACVGIHLLIAARRRLPWFALGALPAVIAFVAYNEHAFGSFLSFGQLPVGAAVAKAKTGHADLWSTPLWLGVAGLLFSPSRGLFVYTPLAIISLFGVVRAWRDPAFEDLRPLAAGALLMLTVAAKWFDWWGGWTFGYRPIVDAMILLALLSLPVIEQLASKRALKMTSLLLASYSFFVQLVGAFVYDVSSWNSRVVWQIAAPGADEPRSFDDAVAAQKYALQRGGRVEKRVLNIDAPEHRHRLWSLSDSPLVYYLTRFWASRERRERTTTGFIVNDG